MIYYGLSVSVVIGVLISSHEYGLAALSFSGMVAVYLTCILETKK